MNADLLQMAKPFIDTLLENIVKPKVKEFSDKFKLEYEKNFVSKWEHFGEYMYRTYKKYSIVNTLALKNQQKFLKTSMCLSHWKLIFRITPHIKSIR